MATEQEVEDFFAHHGVKGMKWGVRKDRGHEGEAVKTRHLAKLDKKWQKNIYSTRGAIAIHNHIAERMNNGELDKLNNKPEYLKAEKLIDFDTGEPVGAVGKRYLDDYNKLVTKLAVEAAQEVHGTSPSGNFVATYDVKRDRMRVAMTPGPHQLSRREARRIGHAGMGDEWEDLEFQITKDSAGRIIQMWNVDDSAAQAEAMDDFFAHYGVKGMKWGTRHKRRSESHTGTSPGNSRPSAHELSDDELRDHIARMQLERQYSELVHGVTPKKKSEAAAFIADLGKSQVKNAAQLVGTHVIKQALTKRSGG